MFHFMIYSFQACDSQFPLFDKTSAVCNQERILNNMTVYRWQIQSDDVIGGYRDVSLPVFFTKTNTITLDRFVDKFKSIQELASFLSHQIIENKIKFILPARWRENLYL